VDFDTDSAFGSVSISAVDFDGGPSVTFTALGACVADGWVDLAAGAHAYRVTVAPVTGRVSVVQVP